MAVASFLVDAGGIFEGYGWLSNEIRRLARRPHGGNGVTSISYLDVQAKLGLETPGARESQELRVLLSTHKLALTYLRIAGLPLMHWLAEHGHTDSIDAAVAAGADVNQLDDRGETPLVAIAKDCLRPVAVKALIAGGADVNRCNSLGQSPLFLCVKRGNVELTHALLTAGANPNQQTEGLNATRSSPLHEAVAQKNINLVTTLLNGHADPNMKNQWGETPLHLCCAYFVDTAVARKLIESGASWSLPRGDGKSAYAIAQGNPRASIIAAQIERIIFAETIAPMRRESERFLYGSLCADVRHIIEDYVRGHADNAAVSLRRLV